MKSIDFGRRLKVISDLVAGKLSKADDVHRQAIVREISRKIAYPSTQSYARSWRISTRVWMMLVLVFGVFLGGGIELTRVLHHFSECTRKSGFHASKVATYRWQARYATLRAEIFAEDGRSKQEIATLTKAFDPNLPAIGLTLFDDYHAWSSKARRRIQRSALEDVRQYKGLEEYHAKLKENYDLAALRPWQSVPADPRLP